MITDIYRQSFNRNIGIVSEEDQEKLATKRVAIVGLGGIGGNVAVLLARMGLGRFVLADFDRFELANFNRQYGASHQTLDSYKVDVIAEEISRINPAAEIRLHQEGFLDENGDEILTDVDIAVDSIDFYAIDFHLKFHRKAREHGLYVIMGSPVGFSACLQVYDPHGMSIEEYCGIREDMEQMEKQLRYACGLVPKLAHIEYFDVSTGGANTDFNSGTGPSMASACGLAASLVATEIVLILLDRRRPRVIPHTFQFDPFTFRYEKSYIDGGMPSYDPTPVIEAMPDRSSLIAQVFDLFYRKPRADRARYGDLKVCYRVEGEGEQNLLFLSPLGGDSGFWIRQMRDFTKDYRVITLDNPGIGDSSPAPEGLTTELMAHSVIAVLEHLGAKKVHVVGLALGSLIAQYVALLRPDLVDRLVLLSSYAKADETLRSLTEEWRNRAAEEGTEPLFDLTRDYLFTDDYIEQNRDELDKLKTFYRINLQRPRCFIRQSLAGIEHDTTGRLGEIGAETLIINGDRDRMIDSYHAHQLGELIRNSTVKILPEAPHFMSWESHRSLNPLIGDFLSKKKAERV